MSNYEKLRSNYMKDARFVEAYQNAKKQVDHEYEIQTVRDKIFNNDASSNVLDALDLLQKHITDFTHPKRLA